MRSFLLEKAEHLTAQLKTKIHGVSIDIPSFRMKEDDDFAYANVEYDDSAWAELRVGRQWGSRDTVCWFRACVTIPAELQGKPLDLILQPGPKLDNETAAESLLYIDGVESHGLDQWHSEVRLTAAQSAKSSILIALRTWTGMVCRCRFFEEARLAVVNEKAERLYYLMRAATGTLRELDGDSPEYLRLLGLTDEVYRMVDYIHEGEATFDESLEKAYQHLQEKLAELTVLPKSRTVAVCGHSHIDMAWLWQLHHTHDKASRTFSTVLSLMERYPNFLYSQSSPYLYDQIAKKYPKIFENIKKRIAEGRWEVTGGMWVEPDTNLSGGEALVRQLLLGKNYIRSEFGQDCTVLWLPDVFGYSWVLPQLLKKSGIKYMWTNKMSWNQ